MWYKLTISANAGRIADGAMSAAESPIRTCVTTAPAMLRRRAGFHRGLQRVYEEARHEYDSCKEFYTACRQPEPLRIAVPLELLNP